MNLNHVLNHKIYRKWYLVALISTISCAFFASGYHHPDEYMQIIEFANYKMGGIAASQMPWEFHEKMRPWLLPGFFYVFSSVLKSLGCDGPFLIISLFRLFWGMMGLCASLLLGQIIFERTQSEESRRWGVGATALLFYLPWLYTRASSESVGAVLLLLGFAAFLVFREKGRHATTYAWRWLLSGVLLGFAFHTRYHIGVMIPGMWAWMYFVEKVSRRNFLSQLTGLLLALGLGFLVDNWGYETLTLTPYNYFYQNIVLQKAAQWGTKPFWFYPLMIQENIMPVITILLTLAYVVALIRRPQNLMIISTTIFLLIHSLVGHKELRFLFPIAVMAPMYVTIARGTDIGSRILKVINPKVLVLLNMLALIVISLAPTRPEVLLQKKVYRSQVRILVYHDRNPYLLGDNPVEFTKPENLHVLSEQQFQSSQPVAPYEYLYVTTQMNEVEIAGCESKWRLFPTWIVSLNFNNWLERTGNWSLYKCRL